MATRYSSDIAEVLSNEFGFKTEDSRRFVNTVFSAIQEFTSDGDSVTIRGFGTFGVRMRAGRNYNNPQNNGEFVFSRAKFVPYFAVGEGYQRSVDTKMNKR